MHAELVYIDYRLEVIEAKKMSVSYTHVIFIKTTNIYTFILSHPKTRFIYNLQVASLTSIYGNTVIPD